MTEFAPAPRKWTARLRELLTGPSAVNSVIVACGNAVQALAGLAATMLVTRALGPSDFGIFAVALGAATTASSIMDFGLNASLLRHSSRAVAVGDNTAAIRLTRAYAQLNAIFFLAVGGVGLAASGPLARDFMHFPHVALIRWACAGALSLNLLVFGRGLLEARQRFRDVAVVNAGTSLFRLVVVGIFWAAKSLTPGWVLTIYLLAPATGLIYVFWRLPDILFAAIPRRGLAPERREILSFSGWYGIGALLSSVAVYLDTMLINRWCDAASVGYYSAAYRLAFVVITASFPIASVLRARASAFGTVERLESFLDKSRYLAVLAAFGVAAVWIAAPPAVRLFLGPAYAPAVPLLRILSVGTGFMFAGGQFLMAFYALGRSRPFAMLSFAQLFIFLLALGLLIPRFGIVGAALAFSLMHAIIFVLIVITVRVNISSARAAEMRARS